MGKVNVTRQGKYKSLFVGGEMYNPEMHVKLDYVGAHGKEVERFASFVAFKPPAKL